jgi:hypothetical protein
MPETTFEYSWKAPFDCRVWWDSKDQPFAKGGAIQKDTPTDVAKHEELRTTAKSKIRYEQLPKAK